MVCNVPAGDRLSRKLYWSPLAWRASAFATPFVVMFLGFALDQFALVALFWPLVIVLLIAHVFVRKKLVLEIAICPRHRRLRLAFQALSLACMVLVVALPFAWQTAGDFALSAVWVGIFGLLVLAVLQSFFGAQAITVKRMTEEHAWLGGTGRSYREALPELPG